MRLFRWYGVKKSFYDALHNLKYKGNLLPLADVMRVVDASSETPWWIVLPAFGGNQHEAYFQNPSPAQLKGMMHLSMAHGAAGILLFQYQAPARGSALVDPVTLKHLDGKLVAAGEVAALITRHAELIRSLKYGGLDVRCRNPYIAVVPRKAPHGKLYIYAVNSGAKSSVSTRLLVWGKTWDLGKVTSVFSGKDLKIETDKEGYLSIPLKLEPGAGDLLVTDAKRR